MQVGERMARKKKAMDFSSLDLNLDALGDWGGDEEKAEKEFIRAAKLNLSPVTWDNAEAAADAVDYDKDYFALLSGRFIFGDFIEALVYKKELLPHRVYITTLGMSRENIDSIVNIVGYLGCEHLNLIVSNYFVAMERAKLVPYMISQFTGQHINVAVLASHCKICLIESDKGNLIIMGSANLSSSNNVEQIMMFHDDKLFRKIKTLLNGIMKKFCILRGYSGKTIFENNTNNIGKKAFETVEEGMTDG